MKRLKLLVAQLANRLSARLPPSLGCWLRNRSWPSRRPTLHYVEFHLTDHCNMNCGGCTHFAPMADRWFADIGRVTTDFARLKVLFRNIRHIRVMGGEPLLHPDCTSFLRVVRDAFPRARLELVTNGLLLGDQPESFWADCRATRTIISLSVYPPIRERLNDITARCRSEGVPLEEKDSSVFMTRYVPEGNIDMRKAFRHCRGKSFFCPILREGRIYNCAMGCYAHYWNRSAPTPFPVEKGLSLAESTGVEILLYLMRPMPTCAHCASTTRDYPWHNGAPKLEDWIR